MSRNPEVQSLTEALSGQWVGSGQGGYPTIDSFDYRETLEFTQRDDHPALHYDQRTWRQADEGEVPSHWETGLLMLSSDGSALLHNAQPDRTEVMLGTWVSTREGWEIRLLSTGYAGDGRMVRSTRNIAVRPGSLTYVMEMETISVPILTRHLTASLTTSQT